MPSLVLDLDLASRAYFAPLLFVTYDFSGVPSFFFVISRSAFPSDGTVLCFAFFPARRVIPEARLD